VDLGPRTQGATPGRPVHLGASERRQPTEGQRYLSDWGAALRQRAALHPEILLAGHGLPIFGADRIVAALTDTAELLESVESQTLAIMNQGKRDLAGHY